MRKLAIAPLLPLALPLAVSSLFTAGCAARKPYPTVDDLELDTVVLYRNSRAMGGAPSSASGAVAEQARGPSLDLESLRRSTAASTRSQRISGLTRVDLSTPVTVPDGTSTMVTSAKQYSGQEMTVTRIVRGVLEVEWPAGTEDLEGAWLIPVTVPANEFSATIKVVEQTPSKTSIAIWDQQAIELLEKFLAADNLDAEAREKLQPVVDLRREIGRIDTEVDGLRRQQAELEQRAEQTRRNLEAIKKDPAAGALRARLNKRLDEFSSEADDKGRKIVELKSRRLEQKIELEDMIQDLDLRAPSTPARTGPSRRPKSRHIRARADWSRSLTSMS